MQLHLYFGESCLLLEVRKLNRIVFFDFLEHIKGDRFDLNLFLLAVNSVEEKLKLLLTFALVQYLKIKLVG